MFSDVWLQTRAGLLDATEKSIDLLPVNVLINASPGIRQWLVSCRWMFGGRKANVSRFPDHQGFQLYFEKWKKVKI